jgi:biopolymer transport protein ExbB/biopolymer transport protein TolQ
VIVERLLKIALAGSSWVLYLLFALSIVSMAAMLERYLFFRKHRGDLEALRRELYAALFDEDLPRAERVLRASASFEAEIALSALRWWKAGPEAMADFVESEIARVRKELERGSTLLGTLGNNAPFVGLLGTVIGVIEAFHQLGDATQAKGGMGNVMNGIAEALVATGVGLFVAIPAVVAFNVVQKKIADIESHAQQLTKLVTAFVKASHRETREGSLAPSDVPVVTYGEGLLSTSDIDALRALLAEEPVGGE